MLSRAKKVLTLLEASHADPLDPAALFVPGLASPIAPLQGRRPGARTAGPQLGLFAADDPRATRKDRLHRE